MKEAQMRHLAIIHGWIFIKYLVFQTTDRYNPHTVFPLVSKATYSDKYHHECWGFHLVCIYFRSQCLE